MALNLLLCGFRLFMFYWTRYHTDLEQMLKKKHRNIRQNGHRKLETSIKVGLQHEGAHNRHSETVINLICQFLWGKKHQKQSFGKHSSCKIQHTMAFCPSFC